MPRLLVPLIVCLLFAGWGTPAVHAADNGRSASSPRPETSQPHTPLLNYGVPANRGISPSAPENKQPAHKPPIKEEGLQIPVTPLGEEGILDSLTVTQKPGKLEGSIFRHRVKQGEAFNKINIFTSAGIFIAIIITMVVNRIEIAIVGMAGAVLMTLVGNYMGFYSPDEALKAIDLGTLGLILGMMIVTGLLEHSGFFQLLAFFLAAKFARSPKLLLIAMGTVTAVLSMVVNNVTMVMVVAPVTIIATELLEISPTPFIMAEAMLATIGGTASLVGDPPNIMIGSAAHITFNNFFIHMSPISVSAAIVSFGIVIGLFWKELRYKARREEAERFIDIKARVQRVNTTNMITLLACLGVIIVLFILQSMLHLEPYFITLIGASLALVLVRPDIKRLLSEIEWSIILFYGTLFVCVGGLEKAGVLELIAAHEANFTRQNMVIAVLIIAWSSALMSMVIENSVLTLALIPVFLHLKQADINITPLWWALAMGVTFGGNATPIGATTNILVMFFSRKTKQPITFGIWMKLGMPITFAIVTLGSGLIILLSGFYSY